MAYVLIVGSGGTNYRLPADTDLSALRRDIADTFVNRGALELRVELGDNPLKTASLILNGNALECVAVIEVDADPGQEPSMAA